MGEHHPANTPGLPRAARPARPVCQPPPGALQNYTVHCRQQFVIAAEGELCRVKSLSAVNPTKVYRPGPPLSAILLEQGGQSLLHRASSEPCGAAATAAHHMLLLW